MIGAIRPGRGGRSAIAEFGSGRIAERPAAHRLFEFDDRHSERHRHDDALEFLLAAQARPAPAARSQARSRRASSAGQRGQSRPADAMQGRGAATRRGREAAELGDFARPARPSRWTFPITALRVTPLPSKPRVARALAVYPMLLELFDYFVRPSHCRLVCLILRQRRRSSQIKPRRLARSPPGVTLTCTLFETPPTTSRGPQEESYTTR